MDLDELNFLYEQDSKIDQLNLEGEILRSALMHAKYLRFLANERRMLQQYQNEMKKLKPLKMEHYSQGPSKETKKMGWDYPHSGVILKTNIPMYMDADNDLMEIQNQIDLAQNKIDILEKMVQFFAFRNNSINYIFSIRKFESGA